MKFISLVSTLLVAGIVSFAGIARAQVLTLEVSRTTLETWISNNSAAVISIDGYQLTSSLGLLEQTTWRSIPDSVLLNTSAATAALGPGALDFFESAGLNNYFMSEFNPFSVGVWQPGTRWSIGYPFGHFLGRVGSIESDIGFAYTGPSISLVNGPVVLVPEPGSLALVLVAAGCWPRRRR